jgi:photosystem II stability/assembly factor-like uncharacterized protein
MRKKLYLGFMLLSQLLVSSSLGAQWRKLADFKGFNGINTIDELIRSVYFLDLPGPPRIGFVGTTSELWKTNDGGSSWAKVWGDGNYSNEFVTDICFKDSLVGWFGYVGSGTLYRTTNGGQLWKQLRFNQIPSGIYYSSFQNKLFVGGDSAVFVSTNLGNSWDTIRGIEAGGFSFFTDSIGIALYVPPITDTTHFMVRTTDCGLTWKPSVAPPGLPLVIPGTSTSFVSTANEIQVYRSDDYGETWNELYDFGPPVDSNYNHIAPIGTGVIRGDLSHLLIQTDSGMFLSIDQGMTWRRDGGPQNFGTSTPCLFYCQKGVAMVGKIYADGALYGDGLWEEDWAYSSVEPTPELPTAESDKREIFDLLGRCVYRGLKEKVPALLPGAYIERAGTQIRKVLR